MTREELLFAIFTGAEATHFYSALEPSPATIETFLSAHAEGIAAVRRNLVVAGAGTVGLGLVVGQLVKSPLPIYAAIVTVIVMTGVYEGALARASGMEVIR